MKDDRRVVVFLICLAIATVFWFLNALNKEYTVDLSFPVKYTNLPKNKILANSPPDHFTLKVKSFGFTILRHKLSMAFSPLVFNVNDFTGKKMEASENSKFRIGTRQFINRISGQVSNELQIIEIQPDSLYFEFDRIIQRKVKVKPNITYTLKQQYFLSGDIATDPDSVVVSGAESTIDTIQSVLTKQQHYKDLDKNIQRNVLLETYKKIDIEPKRVILKIPLEEYTEKNLLVPIQITDVPDDMTIKLFPDKAKVSFLVGLSHFSEIKEADFNLTVPYSDVVAKKEILNVTLKIKPLNILSISVSPENVEYLIEKKSDD
ncbi:YbbR-like domain-containing protein [Mangrovibacterium lignilyticum]|uniref:YbbR-like domain-containing protein n=1 Tax=Mangrovibacterium lignilyticum TaxID=2668052 RepID=UPI0013D2A7DB|nr:YbbR-like domain-containing protein [Mangrovibacterium lignilyticum]